MAIWASQLQVEIREVELKNKPSTMLEISPKGSVPVLQLPDGTVIEQSLEIMQWALGISDPLQWLPAPKLMPLVDRLISANDTEFKKNLDRYKYPIRFPEAESTEARARGEVFLAELDALLTQHTYLVSDFLSIADIAIFPFVRQFSSVEPLWFQALSYKKLQGWLEGLVVTPCFEAVMRKYEPWVEGELPR